MTPTGTVTFTEGATTLGTAALNASGLATLTMSTLSIGNHMITATFGATPTFNSSSSTATASIVALGAGNVLQGRVTNRSTGAPIAGAHVHVSGSGFAETTTDANGIYVVTGGRYAGTSGSLFVDATGYYSQQSVPFTGAPRAVDFTLLPGGPVLRGTIRDASTGAPIAGASVSYSGSNTYQWGATVKSTMSDVNGVYVFDSSQFTEAAATNGTQGSLQVTKSGYLSTSGAVTATLPLPKVTDFTLIPGTVVLLEGTITNRITGAPIAGATVNLCCNGSVAVQTDAAGHYSVIGNQYPYTSGSMFVDAPGYYTLQLPYSGAPRVMDLTLLPGGPVLRGTIRDASTGAPIAGASVSYSGSNTYQWGATVKSTMSDVNGVYVFDSSQFTEAAATNGTQGSLQVTKSGYFSTSGAVTATLPLPKVTDFTLIPGTVVLLEGTITNRITGAPIAGATVNLCCNGSVAVQTDAAGHYSVIGNQYPYTSGSMFVDAPGYYTLQLPYSGAPRVMDLTLLPGGPVLRGTIRDASTGAPTAGASVSYAGSNTYQWGATVKSTMSDVNGVYVFDSSQFTEAAATAGTQGGLSFNAQPSYLNANLTVNTTPPWPRTFDLNMTPTGTTVSVTVGINSSGLAFQVDGVEYTTPQVFTWVPHNVHTISTSSPQQATADTRKMFMGWSDGGAISRTIVTPNSSGSFTANFVTQYLLTTTANPSAGGTVTSGNWINANTTVTLTAVPDAGYRFDRFSGAISSTTNPVNLVMNGPKFVTAQFVSLVPIATDGALTTNEDAPRRGVSRQRPLTICP